MAGFWDSLLPPWCLMSTPGTRGFCRLPLGGAILGDQACTERPVWRPYTCNAAAWMDHSCLSTIWTEGSTDARQAVLGYVLID